MLERITSYEDFSHELTRFRRENRPFYTNCYLYGNKLRDLIEGGKMHVQIDNGSLSLFQDEGDYYECYYYVGQSASFPRFSLDKLATLYLVRNTQNMTPDIESQRDKLRDAGFQWDVNNIQFSANLKEVEAFIREQCAKLEERICGKPFALEFFQPQDYPELLRIWKADFRFYRLPYLTATEIEKIAKQQEILLVRDISLSKIAAAYHMMDYGNGCEGRRIVVERSYRGNSLGALVFFSMLKSYIERGYQSWIAYVDEDNTVSQNLHGKVGKKTGIWAEQYILPLSVSADSGE